MFGFTRNEQRVLLFLSAGFLAGGAIKIVQGHYRSLPVPSVNSIISEDGNPPMRSGLISNKNQTETVSFFTVPLNTATQTDLESIPGIGPVMAKRILSYREEKGRFESVEELRNVKGIGPKKLLKIRPYIKIQ